MNLIYAKAVLYAYPHLDEIKEQTKELSYKQAISSMTDTSPAFSQCERLVYFAFQSQTLDELKEMTEKALSKLTPFELDLLDYKYFKIKPKAYYENFDCKSRTYFRKQVSLIKKVAEKLEKYGVTDAWFDDNCMCTYFFRDMVETVIEYQEISIKNRGGKNVRLAYS